MIQKMYPGIYFKILELAGMQIFLSRSAKIKTRIRIPIK